MANFFDYLSKEFHEFFTEFQTEEGRQKFEREFMDLSEEDRKLIMAVTDKMVNALFTYEVDDGEEDV